jgi:hypothetical protein
MTSSPSLPSTKKGRIEGGTGGAFGIVSAFCIHVMHNADTIAGITTLYRRRSAYGASSASASSRRSTSSSVV